MYEAILKLRAPLSPPLVAQGKGRQARVERKLILIRDVFEI